MNGVKIHKDAEISNALRDHLSCAFREVMSAIDAEGGSLFLFDPENQELVLDEFHNSKKLYLQGLRQKVGEGVSGRIAGMKTPVLVKNIDADARFHTNGFKHYRTSSFISIPLFDRRGLVGLINLTDKADGRPFTEEDLKIASAIAKYASSVADNTLKKADKTIVPDKQPSFSFRERFHDIVGKSPSMQKIYSLIEAVAGTRATVLIHGETGTGKRVIAHAIHHCNEVERVKPFVEVSCGALTETLLESELFGHIKGAFTGAIKDKIGRFELANGGTIFLDEIDAFSPALQVKLLRVLQEGEFERVGDTRMVKVDVRVIASTNQNLIDLIAQGKFRKDLYYRLNIISIDVPPLRQRTEDIPLLLEAFIKKFSQNNKRKIECVSTEALSILAQYNWPGNVRELENVIERAVILSKGPVIMPYDLPEPLHADNAKDFVVSSIAYNGCKLKDALKEPEKDLLVKALDSVKWNRNEAAKKLGINRTTLYKKMRHFGLLKNDLR